jgi:hypothetical protein
MAHGVEPAQENQDRLRQRRHAIDQHGQDEPNPPVNSQAKDPLSHARILSCKRLVRT